MTYVSRDKHLKISVSIFLDDLEKALHLHSGDPKLDIADPNQFDFIQSQVGDYLQENLQLDQKGKSIPYEYLGSEIEGDVLWSYLEVQKLKKLQQLTVKNTLLQEIFEDQENLVHVRNGGIVRSARLLGSKPVATLTWDR